MLQELSIRNLAIIDDIQIVFSNGFTVLSGETGAGKSIIINAVNLLLGGRATSKHIRTGASTAEIEALFQVGEDSRVSKTLEEAGYEASATLLVRRIISGNDRHRLYINGRIATVRLLNAIAANLASISGQHANQGLLDEGQHLEILDRFGGLADLRADVAKQYHNINPLIRRLAELKQKREKRAERIEALKYEKREIEDAAIAPGEDEALERELRLLKNAEMLYQAVHGSVDVIYSADSAVVERLAAVNSELEKAAAIDSSLSGPVKGISDASFQLEDIATELRSYLSGIIIDEGRIEDIEGRLDFLRKLARKYGGSLESTLAHLESATKELSGIENISDEIADAESELAKAREKLIDAAKRLSEERNRHANSLSEKVENELASLQMDKTRFQVSLEAIPASGGTDNPLVSDGKAIGESGMDKAVFLIAPNVGEALKPLSGIASGGELSRVVLALKAILAETDSVETVIFDEVDAGIGGGVAEVVGEKLRELSEFYQVICITHLPQIAKFGRSHFRIFKQIVSDRTSTVIEPLDEEERVQEIARMLGGIEMTQTTLDHAVEMLESAK